MITRFLQRPIFQYAWVVNDLDAGCKRWAELFGAGPFFTARRHKAEGYFRYRGKPEECELSYAFAYCGPVQIQLIELHDETPSIFSEMFPRGGEGFHHVGILSEDFACDRQRFLDRGLDLAVEMWSGADVCYFDARKQIGCFVEMHGSSEIIRDIFAGWKTAHEGWDGTNPVREPTVQIQRQKP